MKQDMSNSSAKIGTLEVEKGSSSTSREKSCLSKNMKWIMTIILVCAVAVFVVVFSGIMDSSSSSSSSASDEGTNTNGTSPPSVDSDCQDGDSICESNHVANLNLLQLHDSCEADNDCLAAISVSVTTGVRANITVQTEEHKSG